jgi:glycosyltransferase involved in cell wall biosynthesis
MNRPLPASHPQSAVEPGSHSVSVLVSSYNYAAYIVEAIESVLAQTHPALEVIVVDDGSTDHSAALVRAHFGGDVRVRLIEQANGGQLSAWMRGFAEAQGDVIALLDSDDRWSPEYLARVTATYQQTPSADFVFRNMYLFGDVERLMHPPSPDRDLGLSVVLGSFYPRWQGVATSGLTLRRDLMGRLLDLPPAMASQWVTRPDDCLVVGADILGAHKVYIGEPLVGHREHGHNALGGYQRSRLQKARYSYRVQEMIAHYRQQAGITDAWLSCAKAEFRTKPKPRLRELGWYWRLLGLANLPFTQRWEHRVAIVGHYLKGLRA